MRNFKTIENKVLDEWKEGIVIDVGEENSTDVENDDISINNEYLSWNEKKDEDLLLDVNDARYPKLLRERVPNCKPLYCKGNIALLQKPALAVVGSRHPNGYGKKVAFELGRRCAQLGIVLVSGLARGIDVEGHKGSLSAGGETIAVLANGVNVKYPKENCLIQNEIELKGLLTSEYPMDTEPKPYFFPQRNRLISGLCQGVVVVQAESRSGSLITAECAIEQGVEVFAVPGNIVEKMSMGPNKLIADGAAILTNVEDVFEHIREFARLREIALLNSRREVDKEVLDLDDLVYTVAKGESKEGSFLNNDGLREGASTEPYNYVEKNVLMEKYQSQLGRLNALERQLVSLLTAGEVSMDKLSQISGLPLSKLGGIVTVLEMKGIVYCQMGKIGIK